MIKIVPITNDPTPPRQPHAIPTRSRKQLWRNYYNFDLAEEEEEEEGGEEEEHPAISPTASSRKMVPHEAPCQ